MSRAADRAIKAFRPRGDGGLVSNRKARRRTRRTFWLFGEISEAA